MLPNHARRVIFIAAAALVAGAASVAAPAVTQLGNGLRVCVAEDASSDIVAIQVVIRATADCEPDDKAGLRTLVQHTIHAGWDREIEQADDLAFMRDMQDIRGGLSINTDWEYVALGYSGISETLPQALAFLAERVFRSEFTDEDHQAAIDIVRSAAGGPHSAPAESTIALFRLSLLGRAPRAYPLGTAETVGNISLGDVKAFHRRFYVPNLATVCVVGPVAADVTHQLVEKQFGNLPAGDDELPGPPPLQTAPEARVDANRGLALGPGHMDVASLVVGVPAPGLGDPDEPVAYLVHGLLGANGLSRGRLDGNEELWGGLGLPFPAEAARRNQLIESLPPPTSVRAHVAIHAYVAPRRAEQVRKALIGQFDELARAEPSEEELTRAKEYVIGSFATLFDVPDNRALLLGRSVAMGLEGGLASSWSERVMRVTPGDVTRVAKEYFAVHAVGIELPEEM